MKGRGVQEQLLKSRDGEACIQISSQFPRGALVYKSINHFRKAVNLLCSNNQVDMVHAFENSLTLLLRNAAGNANKQAWFFLFCLPERTQQAVHFLLCLIPNAARIDQDEIRLFNQRTSNVSFLSKKLFGNFRIPFVHLAAKSFYIKTFIHKNIYSDR